MSEKNEISYIEAEVIGESLEDPEIRNKFSIIDVRDEDFEGGHIPGAVNYPSETFNDPKILEKIYFDNKDKTIVFHCFKSQQRGPTCARIFNEYVKKNASNDLSKPEIKVMRGGYQLYSSIYNDNPNKIEK